MAESDPVGAYHLTEEQLSDIWTTGGGHVQESAAKSSNRDVRIFDCHCDAFLHNEQNEGAYDLARFLARDPASASLDLCAFTQLFCSKAQQAAFLSHKFYKDSLPEHINTWELLRILFCDFLGEFSVDGAREPPPPAYLPDDEACRETTESLLRLPGETPKLQVLCRCLHWLEQTARRSDWHDPSASFLKSVTQFDKSCATSAVFDPDSNPIEYKNKRVDLSEPVYHALRRGDPRFAADMLVKNKEYWFSSFIRLCAPTFFNLPHDAFDVAGSLPKPPVPCVFLPQQPVVVPFVRANEFQNLAAQRKYFKDHANKDGSELLLRRHDVLDCGSSAPQLLHALEVMRSMRSDLVDDRSFTHKVFSAMSDNCNFKESPPSPTDLLLPAQDFLWKKLRSAWVYIIECKLRRSLDLSLVIKDVLKDVVGACTHRLHAASGDSFFSDVQLLLVCAALSESPEAALKQLADRSVAFVDRHKKPQDQSPACGQELAFCAHLCMFLNAVLRARNAGMSQKPKIFPEMSRKFTGLDPRSNPFSLPTLVFKGQIFGGCMLEDRNIMLGNFYASHITQAPQPDDCPKLWQKLGLMIACCAEKPEETCMQEFCDLVSDHSDLPKLRKWMSVWVTWKLDPFHAHKLSEAQLALVAQRQLALGAQRQAHNSAESAHREVQRQLEYDVRDLQHQIDIERSNHESKKKLLEALARVTLDWAKRELEHARQSEGGGRTAASRLLECLRGMQSKFWPENGDWVSEDVQLIGLSDLSELYGLHQALVVAQKVKNIGVLHADLATTSSVVPRLIAALHELQHLVRRYSPMRHLHIVPLLVEEALRCCLELRNTLLQLLLAGAAAVETSDSKTMMADLYRRIHDTVQSITIDLADRSAVRGCNVEFYVNRKELCSPLDVLFDDGHNHHVLRLLVAFAAEDRFGGYEPDDWL